MPAKRIIPCLDIKDRRVVKGVNFVNLKDAGDPVELASRYYAEGADELVFLDISASNEKRKTMKELVTEIASVLRIPFTVGGGISSVADIEALLKAGADKVSLNTAIVKNPGLVTEAAKEFGSQAVVAAIDTRNTQEGGRIYINGGKVSTEFETISWCREAKERGAGEILLTSMDRDGTRSGFDLEVLREVCSATTVPVIASGGAGSYEHFREVFVSTKCEAALAAGLFHSGEMGIASLKQFLTNNGIEVRL